MSPSPANHSRWSGCFMMVFFGLFAAIPLFIGWSMFSDSANFKGSKTAAAAILTLFIAIGLAGFCYGLKTVFGKSKTAATKSLEQAIPGAALPQAKDVRLLANNYFRLDPESTHAGKFWLLLFAAIFWNGITWIFVSQALWGNNNDSPPTWFLLIFVAVGIVLIVVAVKSFFRWVMVGETHVDVSTPTAVPGQIIELLVSQPGRYTIDQMTVDFVCRETARYRAGTDTRTKTDIVCEAPVCDHTSLTAREGKVLTHQSARIPADAMLSFKASNNEITWLIRVKMILQGRPDVEQFFPIRVVSQDILKVEAGSRG